MLIMGEGELGGVAVKVRETVDTETGVKFIELVADEVKDIKIKVTPAVVVADVKVVTDVKVLEEPGREKARFTWAGEGTPPP
jgi:hypothetical protein